MLAIGSGQHRISLEQTEKVMQVFEVEMKELATNRFRRVLPATELQHESRVYHVSELRRFACLVHLVI